MSEEKLHWQCSREGCERKKLTGLDICMSHQMMESKEQRAASQPKSKPKPLQRGGPIRKVSEAKVSYGSDGTAYTNEDIAQLRKRCYDHLDFDGKPPYCSAHGYQCSEWMLDHDHTIAQSACKIMGKTELIWDEGNIEFSCRTAHKEWESYKSGEFIKHKNFEKRMAFVKIHDYEMWERRIAVWEAMIKPKENI